MASPIVVVLSGANLNLLGQREPGVYGSMSLDDHLALARSAAKDAGIMLEHVQSNEAGELVAAIHAARGRAQGIIINPGAYSHTSVAILDALNAFDGVVLEVHISNIHKREAFRHHSYVSSRAEGVIAGFGTEGYLLALRRMATLLA